jgi:hypothetical protein
MLKAARHPKANHSEEEDRRWRKKSTWIAQ